MDEVKKYNVLISKDALSDIQSIKTYILETFKYREYAEDFSKKVKRAIGTKGQNVLAIYYQKNAGNT